MANLANLNFQRNKSISKFVQELSHWLSTFAVVRAGESARLIWVPNEFILGFFNWKLQERCAEDLAGIRLPGKLTVQTLHRKALVLLNQKFGCFSCMTITLAPCKIHKICNVNHELCYTSYKLFWSLLQIYLPQVRSSWQCTASPSRFDCMNFVWTPPLLHSQPDTNP